MFWKRAKTEERDLQHQMKLQAGQRALLEAATATANAAQEVTSTLKSKLDDSVMQFESTARILNDALFLCDLDGVIRSSNPASVRMFGRTSLYGTSVLDLFDLDGDTIADPKMLWYLIGHTSSWLPTSTAPLRGKRADGSLFWVEPNTTRLEWSNQTSSMLLIVRNIDPLVTLRDKAQTHRQHYKSIFEHVCHGIMIEQNDIIVAANPSLQKLFGYTSEELLGQPVAKLFVEEDRERVEADLKTCNMRVTGVHADGNSFAAVFSGSQIAWNNQIARLITVRST